MDIAGSGELVELARTLIVREKLILGVRHEPRVSILSMGCRGKLGGHVPTMCGGAVVSACKTVNFA
jgi:hypothetical protein